MIGISSRHLASVALLLAVSSAAAAPPRPCADGRFVLPAGEGLLATPGPGDRQVVTLADKRLAIDGVCPSARAKVKASRRATVVGARWRSCAARKNVRLSGSIPFPGCDVLRGSLKAKKQRPIAFEARRSVCGDGFADLAGGETCDLPPGGGTGSEPTPASLDEARDAIAAGATDVPLSPDGTLRFRRAATSTGGVDTIERAETTLVRWVHDGDLSTMTTDVDGDGVVELAIDAHRAPVRAAVVRFDLTGDGDLERTVSMTQVDSTGVEVEIVDAYGGTTAFSTTLLQEATGPGGGRGVVTAEGCTAAQEADAKSALGSALGDGLKCLRDLGLDAIAKVLEGKVARDGVKFRCGGTSDCAQIDILDAVTSGALPTSVGITLGQAFLDGSGICANRPMVMFHELLHLGLGAAHSPFLDRSKFESLATDSVYSCTDLCFRPQVATKSECARCLGVDRCDPKCQRYADGPEGACDLFVDIVSLTCPVTACQCGPMAPPGVRWQQVIDGIARGPVGTLLRTNLPAVPDGELSCPGWTPVSCPGAPGGAGLQCCRREPGQPSQTAFIGVERQPPSFVPINCICPRPAPPVGVEMVAQVETPTAGAEDTVPVTCP